MQNFSSRAIPALAALALLSTAIPAHSEPSSEPEALSSIQSIAPDFIADSSEVEGDARGFTSTNPYVSAEYPENGNGTVDVTTDFGTGSTSYGITLPEARGAEKAERQDSIVSYGTKSGFSTVATAGDDGTVSVGTIIESKSAPREYTYGVSSNGEPAVMTQLDDGSVDVFTADGELLTHFRPAWAVDADGRDVPTFYTINGGEITQTVEHEGYSYPIVADPKSGLYIKKVSLKSDPRGIIIQVYPGSYPANLPGNALFADYKKLVGSNFHGRKYRDQLVCHQNNAMHFKKPWNLDSWRPDVGYAKTVAKLCNP